MAIYAKVEKLEENDRRVRYEFTDINGISRTMVLDKIAERTFAEDGVEDMLYRAVAMKIAAAWQRDSVAPNRLLVQS